MSYYTEAWECNLCGKVIFDYLDYDWKNPHYDCHYCPECAKKLEEEEKREKEIEEESIARAKEKEKHKKKPKKRITLKDWEEYYKEWLKIEPREPTLEQPSRLHLEWMLQCMNIEYELRRLGSKLPLKIIAMGRRWNGEEWVK